MTQENDVALSGRARRLADTLSSWPRQRVQLDELWRILDQADPTTRTDTRRRRMLAGLITELVAAQVVALPAARSYDYSELPALPRFLTVQGTVKASAAQRPIVWHPALAWVPSAGLTRPQVATMQRVNDWLHDSRDSLVVPARERSLQVFGDEKKLDRLAGSALFGPGRLTMEVLRCRRVAPRLHCEPAGDGDLLLVVDSATAPAGARHRRSAPLPAPGGPGAGPGRPRAGVPGLRAAGHPGVSLPGAPAPGLAGRQPLPAAACRGWTQAPPASPALPVEPGQAKYPPLSQA